MKKIVQVNWEVCIFINKMILILGVGLLISCHNNLKYGQDIEKYPNGKIKMKKIFTDSLNNYEFVKYELNGDTTSYGKRIYPYFAKIEFTQDTIGYKFYVEYPDGETYIEEWFYVDKKKDIILQECSYFFCKNKLDSVEFKYFGPSFHELELVITTKEDENWNAADTFKIDVGNSLYLPKNLVIDKKIMGNVIEHLQDDKGQLVYRIRTVHINLEKKIAIQDYLKLRFLDIE